MSVASAGIQVVSVMCGALITSCRLPCFAHIFREVENQHKCGNLHVYHLYTQNLAQLVTNLSRILVSVWGEHFGAVSRFRLGIKRTKNTIFKKIKIFDKSAQEVTVVSYINVLSYQEYTLSSILQYILSRTRRHKTDIDIGSLLCLCSNRWLFSDENKESFSIVLILVQIIQLRWWLYRHQGHYAQERWRRTLYIRRAEHSWTMRRGEVRNNAETGKSISSSSVWWIITELSHKLQCTYLWWQVAVSQCSYPAYQE